MRSLDCVAFFCSTLVASAALIAVAAAADADGKSTAKSVAKSDVAANETAAAGWMRFRGPNGSGVAPGDKTPPVSWSDEENLKWKVKLPGPGSSSPIIVGDKVFVTCWTGYGLDQQDPGDQKDLKRHLVCIDRESGEIQWSKGVDAVLPEDDYRGMFAENGYATHTPVSDGEHVYAFFGKSGVAGFDLEGKKLWQTSVGEGRDPMRWGSSSSPVLYKNLVIVPAAAESVSLVALDKTTGKEVWKQAADGFTGLWGTPIIVDVDKDRTDLVLGVPYEIWGFNPETGKLRWYAESMDSSSMCASVIEHDGVVYAVGGKSGGSVAVKAGGKGDVTKTNVVWSGRDRARIVTPIYHDGRLHWISSKVANAVDAKTGDRVYQARLNSTSGGGRQARNGEDSDGNRGRGGRTGRGGFGGGRGFGGGQDYSSPVAAGDKMYWIARNGDSCVIKLGEKFEQLAQNRFASDDGDYSATPAVADGELFIRSSKFLYCVADKSR